MIQQLAAVLDWQLGFGWVRLTLFLAPQAVPRTMGLVVYSFFFWPSKQIRRRRRLVPSMISQFFQSSVVDLDSVGVDQGIHHHHIVIEAKSHAVTKLVSHAY